MTDLFQPKFSLEPGMRIATAGSCFAQNIGRYIQSSELKFVDAEPAPRSMPTDVARRHGYGLFSARYGNIYTARQLRQLLEDAINEDVRKCAIWHKGDRLYDAMRPNVEPAGFSGELELVAHRLDHLRRVKRMFDGVDVFVFTLGLTECWTHRATGVTFPTAPGTIAGTYDTEIYAFNNIGLTETLDDLTQAINLMRSMAPNLKILLTVSPVPLNATASGQHILRATTYSKSVLRAVAEEVAAGDTAIDYFPSYEIVTGAPFRSKFYDYNLRTVTPTGVATVMSSFFEAYPALSLSDGADAPHMDELELDEDIEDVICEEAMLEAFAST